MKRRQVLAGAAALGVAGAASRAFAAAAAPATDPVVETRHGKVRGQRGVAGGYKFFCVPYGASTEGAGRFMPPKPPLAWAGIREVPGQALIAPQIDPKAVPAQPGSRRAAVSGIGSETGSLETEDCLNVTVYTPGIDSARRPVMVWLHGGGYFAGSGSNPMYEGSSLAVHGDAVVVNVNHRLNVLGYAHMPGSGEEFASSGNVGILDIELALHWVKDNIERFGGDSKRVLVFGQSGGGGKVCALWSMPSARGLFHRAAIQSGATRRLRSVEDGAAASERLLKALGLKTNQARDLQRLPLAQVMTANFELAKKPALPGAPNNFAPVYDNRVVTRQPFDPVANPLNADIPLIVGCTSTENTAFMMGDAEAFKLDMAGPARAAAHAHRRARRRRGRGPLRATQAVGRALAVVFRDALGSHAPAVDPDRRDEGRAERGEGLAVPADVEHAGDGWPAAFAALARPAADLRHRDGRAVEALYRRGAGG